MEKAMESDSLFKAAVRSFFNTFFKVFGFAVALVVIFMGIGVLTNGPQRCTTTVMKPDHNWKMKQFSSSTPTSINRPNPASYTKYFSSRGTK